MIDNENVFVKINGKTLPAGADVLVQVGQKVWVTYRIGKSGRIYVQRISPLVQSN